MCNPNVRKLTAEESGDRNKVPPPRDGERPVEYANRVGTYYVAHKSNRYRKTHGLFLTPVEVADFMANSIESGKSNIRILDPAAGAGTLCCAAVEAITAQRNLPEVIRVVAYEIDVSLIPTLRTCLEYLISWCQTKCAVRVEICISNRDFILWSTSALSALDNTSCPSEDSRFDLVIANPPYFKLSKKDPRSGAVGDFVHGQPNIYSLFMAVGATLLRQNGKFIYITPRSFVSGAYFRRFRTEFFSMIQPLRVHVFGSRRDAFRRDGVLQENIIFTGTRKDCWYNDNANAQLMLTSSLGVHDLTNPIVREVALRKVFDFSSTDKILRLPLCQQDEQALAIVDSWPNRLKDWGLNISTGPVVPYRATKSIAQHGEIRSSHAPLLWMNHVRAMSVQWPLLKHKPEYIIRRGAEPLLVPNRNYVLVRRFTAKEEPRRLVAAPWIADRYPIAVIGLENHLNYIHRPGGLLTEEEAWGIAVFLNSKLVDTWFRTINGNTQVSATELRSMPLPPRNSIVSLGEAARHVAIELQKIDELVENALAQNSVPELSIG